MARTSLTAALFVAALALGATQARAQFGPLFGGPPRPPGSIPNGGGGQGIPNGNPGPVNPNAQPQNYPPQGYPQQGYPQQGYPPQGYPPQSSPTAGTYQGGPRGGGGAIQQQSLPPPPGVAVVDPSGPPSQPLPPGPPPIQRPRGGPPPADAAPPPDDAAVAEPPAQKVVNSTALFSGLDKITGRIINFDVAIGETVQFGALQVTPRACYTRPATEVTNTDAFVEVDEVTLQGEVKRIFTGWMYSASPGLHGVEHAIYDVWLTDCKGAAQTVSATPSADPTPPAAQKPATNQRAAQPSAQQRRPAPPPQQVPPQFR